MIQASNLNLLLLIPVVLQFLFWILVFAYLMTRRRQHPRPTKFAMWAVVIHFVAMLIFLGMRIALPRLVSIETLPGLLAILSCLNTIISFFGTWLFLIAIFAGRDTPASTPIDSYSSTSPLADRTDSNPYASP